jgi:hypothetical protein
LGDGNGGFVGTKNIRREIVITFATLTTLKIGFIVDLEPKPGLGGYGLGE